MPTASKGSTAGDYKVSRSAKAGIIFPVGKITKFLKEGRYAQQVGTGASVFMAAVLEYMCAEIIELSGAATKSQRRSRIMPKWIYHAVKEDRELERLMSDAIVADHSSREGEDYHKQGGLARRGGMPDDTLPGGHGSFN